MEELREIHRNNLKIFFHSLNSISFLISTGIYPEVAFYNQGMNIATKVDRSLEISESFVLEEILSIYRNIRYVSDEEILHGSFNQIESLFWKLDSLITLDLGVEITSNFLKKQELDPVFTQINRFRNLYTVRLETMHARKILASQSPWDVLENFPFYRNYLKLVRIEYEGFGLKPGDRVFFLGSGPLPLTLIVFFREYGIKSIGLEQNFTSANLSKKILDKMNLSKNIRIVDGNHFSLKMTDLTHPDACIKSIMIAAQAEPKKEILDYLLKIVPVGWKISYRIYEKGLMKLLNRNLLLDFLESVNVKRIKPDPPAYNTVVFLEKKE